MYTLLLISPTFPKTRAVLLDVYSLADREPKKKVIPMHKRGLGKQSIVIPNNNSVRSDVG